MVSFFIINNDLLQCATKSELSSGLNGKSNVNHTHNDLSEKINTNTENISSLLKDYQFKFVKSNEILLNSDQYNFSNQYLSLHDVNVYEYFDQIGLINLENRVSLVYCEVFLYINNIRYYSNYNLLIRTKKYLNILLYGRNWVSESLLNVTDDEVTMKSFGNFCNFEMDAGNKRIILSWSLIFSNNKIKEFIDNKNLKAEISFLIYNYPIL